MNESTTTAAQTAPRIKARKKTEGTSVVAPADEQIRLLAYQFYLERAGAPGDPMADWLRAERELAAATVAAPARTNGRRTAKR